MFLMIKRFSGNKHSNKPFVRSPCVFYCHDMAGCGKKDRETNAILTAEVT